MKPKLMTSHIVHENPWYRIRHDQLEWNEGVNGDYFVVEGGPRVAIIAEQDSKLLTVEQYRYTIDHQSLELPMGAVDPHESSESGARRELREETGYDARELEHIGRIYMINSICR